MDRLMDTDIMGLALMLLAAVMVYGAKAIVHKVFRFPEEEAKPVIVLKTAGLLVGVLGMLRIFNII